MVGGGDGDGGGGVTTGVLKGGSPRASYKLEAPLHLTDMNN